MVCSIPSIARCLRPANFNRHPFFLPQGHSIVPATIPIGTILYHGRTDGHVPDVPEWVAFDFEHAYVFCPGPCYVISLQAKRDLRVLYFDGNSAAKMKHGPTNSQEVVIWGKPRPEMPILDYERIKLLCDWGKPLGLDGFIRMEFHLSVFHYCYSRRYLEADRTLTARSCYAIFPMA